MKKTKMMSLLLAFVMIFTMIPISASAIAPITGELNIPVIEPVTGEAPQSTLNLAGEGYSGTITWYSNGDFANEYMDDYFKLGLGFSAKIILSVLDGYYFEQGVTVAVDNATISGLSVQEHQVEFYANFPATQSKIVDFTLSSTQNEVARGEQYTLTTGWDNTLGADLLEFSYSLRHDGSLGAFIYNTDNITSHTGLVTTNPFIMATGVYNVPVITSSAVNYDVQVRNGNLATFGYSGGKVEYMNVTYDVASDAPVGEYIFSYFGTTASNSVNKVDNIVGTLGQQKVTVIDYIKNQHTIGVTAPVKGGSPTQTPVIGANENYTGTVKWVKADGTDHTGSFIGGGEYKAIVTLTANDYFYFDNDGLDADDFSVLVDGSTPAVTFSEDGKTATFEISYDALASRQIVSLEVTTEPTKTAYIEGQDFDKTGMVVKATYDDGSVVEDYRDYTIADGVNLPTGKTSVQLNSNENTQVGTTQAIRVIEREMVSIEVSGVFDKQYYVGETQDFTGMIVTATYNDNTTQVLKPDEYTTTGFNSGTATNSQTITVTETLSGKSLTDDFAVIIEQKDSTDIEFESTKEDQKDIFTENGFSLGAQFTRASTTANIPDEIFTERYMFDGKTYTWEELNALTVKNVGVYSVTAILESDNYYGEKAMTFTIEKAQQEPLVLSGDDKIMVDVNGNLVLTGGSGTGAVTYAITGGTATATIVNGKLVGTTAGTVTIVATKAGDDNYLEAISNTFEVTIVAEDVPTTDLPTTGDSTDLALYVVLFTASLGMAIFTYLKKREKV